MCGFLVPLECLVIKAITQPSHPPKMYPISKLEHTWQLICASTSMG